MKFWKRINFFVQVDRDVKVFPSFVEIWTVNDNIFGGVILLLHVGKCGWSVFAIRCPCSANSKSTKNYLIFFLFRSVYFDQSYTEWLIFQNLFSVLVRHFLDHNFYCLFYAFLSAKLCKKVFIKMTPFSYPVNCIF